MVNVSVQNVDQEGKPNNILSTDMFQYWHFLESRIISINGTLETEPGLTILQIEAHQILGHWHLKKCLGYHFKTQTNNHIVYAMGDYMIYGF